MTLKHILRENFEKLSEILYYKNIMICMKIRIVDIQLYVVEIQNLPCTNNFKAHILKVSYFLKQHLKL